MLDVTNATCEYALAGPECERTFASFAPTRYHQIQIGYAVIGLLLFGLSGMKFIMAMQYLGSKIQKIVFLLIMYTSLTFMVRAVDPLSYDHVLPRFVTAFAINSCTSALYSIFYMINVYWILLLLQKPCFAELPLKIRVCAVLAHIVTWAFVAVDTLLLTRGKQLEGISYRAKLSMFSTMIFLASCTGMFCGFLIQQRIEEAAAAAVAQQQVFPVLERGSYGVTQYVDMEAAASGTTPQTKATSAFSKLNLHRPSHPLAVRMCKLLVAIAFAALAAIGFQMYYAIQPEATQSTTEGELECASGITCDDLGLNDQGMYVLQAVVASVILWAFRKISKGDPNAAAAAAAEE